MLSRIYNTTSEINRMYYIIDIDIILYYWFKFKLSCCLISLTYALQPQYHYHYSSGFTLGDINKQKQSHELVLDLCLCVACSYPQTLTFGTRENAGWPVLAALNRVLSRLVLGSGGIREKRISSSTCYTLSTILYPLYIRSVSVITDKSTYNGRFFITDGKKYENRRRF